MIINLRVDMLMGRVVLIGHQIGEYGAVGYAMLVVQGNTGAALVFDGAQPELVAVSLVDLFAFMFLKQGRLRVAATDILLGCLLFAYPDWVGCLSDGRCRVKRWRSGWRRTRSSCRRVRRGCHRLGRCHCHR